jgi:hypothetical protein
MNLKLSVLLIVIGLVISGCKQKEDLSESKPAADHPTMTAMTHTHTAVIQEVIPATTYTYLNVKEGDTTFWIAVTKQEIEVGETISFAPGLEQRNFESKDLQRTFDTIYLVNSINRAGEGATGAASAMSPHSTMSSQTKPVVGKQDVVIDPIEGGISIAQLFGNTATYGGQSVKIRGKVTKVNSGIMGKNWIHIQDGTEAEGNYDLTVTTQEIAKVGDVVVVQGKITLNKDFGSGYKYDVIMEDAHCHPE